VGLKRIVPPFQGSGLMGVLLTQAVGLGFVMAPLWGSPAHTSGLGPSGFWGAAREAGAMPSQGQNPEGWQQEI